MLRILMIFNLVFFFNQLLAQCPKFPNGNMEIVGFDSIETKPNFYNYSQIVKGWESTTCYPIYNPDASKDQADTCTFSTNAYEGAKSLRIPLDKYLQVWADAFKRDTISGIPSRLSGFYNTTSADSLLMEMLIFFDDNPSKIMWLGSDTLETGKLYNYRFTPTLGDYKHFEISFESDQTEADSFLVYIAWDPLSNEMFEGEVLFDDLSFECDPNNIISNPKIEAFYLEYAFGQIKILSEEPYLKSHYKIWNLNGQLISNGSFNGEVTVNRSSVPLIVQVFNSRSSNVFWLTPY